MCFVLITQRPSPRIPLRKISSSVVRAALKQRQFSGVSLFFLSFFFPHSLRNFVSVRFQDEVKVNCFKLNGDVKIGTAVTGKKNAEQERAFCFNNFDDFASRKRFVRIFPHQ